MFTRLIALMYQLNWRGVKIPPHTPYNNNNNNNNNNDNDNDNDNNNNTFL